MMVSRTYGGSLYETLSTDDSLTWSYAQANDPFAQAPHPEGSACEFPSSDDLLVVWNSCCVQPEGSLLSQRITLSSAHQQ